MWDENTKLLCLCLAGQYHDEKIDELLNDKIHVMNGQQKYTTFQTT